MVEDRIGYRYAKSIFDLAAQQEAVHHVYADMRTIADTCAASRELQAMLKSPIVPADKKTAVLKAVFGPGMQSEMTQLLLDILVRKRREQYLGNIAAAFTTLYNAQQGIVACTLTSAHPLEEAQVAAIIQQVEQRTGQRAALKTAIDPALIGGFVLTIGDERFDGSVATRLRQFDQAFKHNAYIRKY